MPLILQQEGITGGCLSELSKTLTSGYDADCEIRTMTDLRNRCIFFPWKEANHGKKKTKKLFELFALHDLRIVDIPRKSECVTTAIETHWKC